VTLSIAKPDTSEQHHLSQYVLIIPCVLSRLSVAQHLKQMLFPIRSKYNLLYCNVSVLAQPTDTGIS